MTTRHIAIALSLTLAVPSMALAETPAAVQLDQSQLLVDSVNPTPETNPAGAPYPGARGGDQLVVYSSPAGKRTGTNEYGFEVTVEGGRVVRREGANSTIPADGYVLSGHGKAAKWMRQLLKLGTRVEWQPGQPHVKAVQDPEGAVWRATHAWNQLQKLKPQSEWALGRRVESLKQRLAGQPQAVAKEAEILLHDLHQAVWTAYAPLPEGKRAAWYRPLEKDPQAVELTVLRAKEMGISTLYVETLYHGFPIYPSAVYRRWGMADQHPRYVGWDPFQAYLDAGNRHGVRIVPWLHTIYVGHTSLNPVSPFLERHADWLNRQQATYQQMPPPPSTVEQGAYFLDPAHPEVRRFLNEVMVELVNRYKVSELQWDDTRYPLPFPQGHPDQLASSWGYTPVARSSFRARFGRDPVALKPGTPQWQTWERFRMDQLTDLIKGMREAVKQAKPESRFQLVFATGPLDSIDLALQDWPRWADQGIAESLAVLNYSGSLDAIRQNVKMTKWRSFGKVPLVAGVFGAFFAASPEEVLEQIDAAREGGADEISLFSLQQLTGSLPQALKAGVFSVPRP